MDDITNKFIWHHRCHGLLGVFTEIDKMIPVLNSAPYPAPDVLKMVDHLKTNGKFEYAMGLISINVVDINFNPQEFHA